MGLTEASAFKDGKIVNDDVNASAAIDGSKIDPLFTSNIRITKESPIIQFNDNDDNPDYYIGNVNGVFRIRDTTNNANRILINTDGHIDLKTNVDCEGGLDVTGNLNATGQFKLSDDDNSHSIGFKAPATIASNLLFTLRTTDGPFSGYALISDGAGTLSWGVAGGASGNGNNQIFWENDQTVTADYTITNGKNAGSFGPITINSGVTVTVGSGETWSVV